MNSKEDISDNAANHPINFSAALTMQQVESVEREDPHGVSRRITLCILTKSKAELVEMIAQGDAEFFKELLDQVQSFQAAVEAMKEMANSATARLLVAAQEVIDRVEGGAQ